MGSIAGGVTRESWAIPWLHCWELDESLVQSMAPAALELVISLLLASVFPAIKIGIDPGVSKVLSARMTASMGADSCDPRELASGQFCRQPHPSTGDGALNRWSPPPANRGRCGTAAPGRAQRVHEGFTAAAVLGVHRLRPCLPGSSLYSPVTPECPQDLSVRFSGSGVKRAGRTWSLKELK